MAWLKETLVTPSSGQVGILVLSLVVGLVISWYFKNRRKVWMSDKIPGPPPYTYLQVLQQLSGDSVYMFQNWKATTYIWSTRGSLFRTRLGSHCRVIILKAKSAEAILSSSKHIEKSSAYDFIRPWLGRGLLTASGKKWQSRRKVLTPAFHFKILEDFVEVFNKQSEVLVQKLREKAKGTVVDVFPYIALCALDIICETAMGCSINAQGDSESEYVKAVGRMTTLIRSRVSRPWLHSDFLYKLTEEGKEHDACLKVLHDFSYDTTRNRREIMQNRRNATEKQTNKDEDADIGKKKRLAFLDLLLEYNEGEKALSDKDIREEVDTFMFEGHDTTTVAINWSLYLIGLDSQIQERVYEELDALFGESERAVTLSDLREMKYLENCIKEALRLFPSVPLIGRTITEDLTIENYVVPVGSMVSVNTYRLHRDPEQFPDPEKYDPDRFLPENVKKRHPYAYVPFSAGPRNCIGQKFALMEEKIILSSILRNFRVQSTVRREDLIAVGDLILRPHKGNPMQLFPRA